MADPYTFEYRTYAGGSTITLNDGASSTLRALRGFGMPHLRYATEEAPYQHGVIHYGEPYLPERQMIVVLGIRSNSASAFSDADNALRYSLSPFREGETLGRLQILSPNGKLRTIRCWLVEYSGESEDNFSPYWCQRTLTFWAPDPRFTTSGMGATYANLYNTGGFSFGAADDDLKSQFYFISSASAEALRSGLYFRTQTEETEGYVVEYDTSGEYVLSTRTIENPGDMPTPVTCQIFCPFSSAKVENVTTGKSFTISQQISTGYVEVDTEAKTVTYYYSSASTNGLTYLSADSEFWELRPGSNKIKYTVSTEGNCRIHILYYSRYSSIY